MSMPFNGLNISQEDLLNTNRIAALFTSMLQLQMSCHYSQIVYLPLSLMASQKFHIIPLLNKTFFQLALAFYKILKTCSQGSDFRHFQYIPIIFQYLFKSMIYCQSRKNFRCSTIMYEYIFDIIDHAGMQFFLVQVFDH